MALHLPFTLGRTEDNSPTATASDIDIETIEGMTDVTTVQQAIAWLKLNGGGASDEDIKAAIEKYIKIDDELDESSSNLVVNWAIVEALAKKVDKVTGKVLSDNNFSFAYKALLDILTTITSGTFTLSVTDAPNYVSNSVSVSKGQSIAVRSNFPVWLFDSEDADFCYPAETADDDIVYTADADRVIYIRGDKPEDMEEALSAQYAVIGKVSADANDVDANDVKIDSIAGLDATNVQDALEEIFGNSGSSTPITQIAYDALATKENRLYFIAASGVLQKIYYGSTLIARKASDGESLSNVFPLTFPFVFG